MPNKTTQKAAYQAARATGKTHLTYMQWQHVRTPEFKAWFGDWENNPQHASKVVHPETGEPLVVYHTSSWNPLKESEGKAVFRKGTNGGLSGDGIYFSEYPLHQFGSEVTEYFLNIRNPITTESTSDERCDPLYENLIDGSMYSHYVYQRGGLKKNWHELAPEFDGVMNRNETVAVSPNQIKSATHNIGTFSPDNPDIRYSTTTATPPQTNSEAHLRHILNNALGNHTQHIHIATSQTTALPNGNPIHAQAEGWYNPQSRQIILLADRIPADTAAFVAWHELGHRQIHVTGWRDWQKAWAKARQNPTVDALARAIEADRRAAQQPISRTEATEEAAAELYAAHKTRRYDVLENKYHIPIPAAQRAGFTGYFARLQQKLRGIVNRALGKAAPSFSDGQVFQLLNRLDRAKEVGFRQPENPSAPETADVWFDLYEGSNTPFAKAVDAVAENKHIPQRYISLGTTPPALQLAGLPDTQIEIQPRVLAKVLGGKHYLEPDDLKQLPAQINNPIAVLKASPKSTNPDGFVVITELKELGYDLFNRPFNKSVITSLFLKETPKGLQVIGISSIYGRSQGQIEDAVKNDAMLYWHKEKGLQLLNSLGLQLPPRLSSDANLIRRNIKTNADLAQWQTTQRQPETPKFSQSISPSSFVQTEQRIGGKAAYQMALSAGKTALTYTQWVQVRTPEFQAWFGDWESGKVAAALLDPHGEPKVFHPEVQNNTITVKRMITETVLQKVREKRTFYEKRNEAGFITATSHHPQAGYLAVERTVTVQKPVERSREIEERLSFYQSRELMFEVRKQDNDVVGYVSLYRDTANEPLLGQTPPFKQAGETFLTVYKAEMDSAYQRLGIGQALYRYAEQTLGETIYPARSQTDKAQGLWHKRYTQGLFGGYFMNEQGQIKSATANIGTFSPDNPDIRFSFSAPQRSAPMSNDYAPPTYDEIRIALSYIPTPSSYNDWYPMAFAIKDALGENGKDLWHDWSRQGNNYDARVAEATWKSARPKAGGITVATLFKQARDNGYRPDKPAVVLTPEQREQRALETATKNQIFAASEQVHHQAAAKLAHTIWRNSTELTAADLAHPYLRHKGIQDLTAVAGIRINRYQGQNKLVIPVYSRNEQTGKTELVNVQQIDEQGEKRFLYGGQKSGGYAILNGTHADMAQGFYIAEGYATAASVHWATGKPVVIAFDAGNLPVVAARIAERDNLSPETPIYLAADNDRVSQTGLEKATEATAWLGERAQIKLPEFDANDIATWQQKHGQLDKDGKEQFPSDFNDLMELRGLNAVQTAIHAPLSAERIAQVATMQPEINDHIANFKRYNIQPNRPFQFKTLPLDEAGLRFRAQYVLEKFGNEKHRHALIAELAKRGIDIRAQVAELSGQSQKQPETAKLVPQANLTAGGEIPFTQAVDNVVSGKVPAGYIQLGTTPDVLQMLGVPQGKVRISGGTIEKAVADYLNRQNTYDKNRHAVNPDDLKLLPSEMNDPISVFKSSSRADSFVVLTQLYEREHGKEKPIIAAVHLSKGKGKHGTDLIDVVSVYGRSDTQLERAFQDDLLYINAKKVREFLTTHPLQLHWDITSKTELSYRYIKSETDLAQWQNAHRQPEKPLQSPLPNPSQSQNPAQTVKENPMAQQPTPNEIQRHAQNVAQMADAAEREAVMREMAERGIHVRSEVNKILAERAAEMPQQPENGHGAFWQNQNEQPENPQPPEPPQPTAANHAAVAVSEPSETQAVGQPENLQSTSWQNPNQQESNMNPSDPHAVENSIEFGGITQEPSQSPAQSTEAQPQRETISAAEVQENLRRAKEKERIEQAQQFTQEATVGAAIGMAADVALDAAIPGSSMAKTAASVAADLASDVAAEHILQANSAKKAERDAPENEQHSFPEASTYQKPKPILDLDYETPKGLADRYIRMEGKYLDFKNHQTVMFEDKGKKLNTAQTNPQIINDMLDTAQAKNWDSIKISGSLEFKQQVWLEAELRGIKTTGYKPTKEDIAKRDYLLESRYRNSIEAQHQPEIDKSTQQDKPQPEPSQQLDSPKPKHEPQYKPSTAIDKQNAGSLFDDAPKTSLPPMSDNSAALHSAADKAKALADTPQEQAAASQMQHQAAHASIQQGSLKAQAMAEQVKPAQPINPELDSARAVYLQKAATLNKADKLHLQYMEEHLARLINRYPPAEQDEFWQRHYEETANDIKGGKLLTERPKQETKPSPSQTSSQSRNHQQHEQGDDGVEMGD